MIKDIVIGVALTALAAAGVMTKKGFDATYMPVEELEKYADVIYVRNDTYRQTENQKRIWQLEDRIQKIKNNAGGRPLTPDEQNRIKQLQRDIQRISG